MDAKRNLYFYFGFIPVLLIIILLEVFWIFVPTATVLEPRFLLLILNTIFLFLISLVVSYMAMRTYLISGVSTALFLGSGVLTLGTGALAAGWSMTLWGPNAVATIHNISALISSIFHVAAVIVMEKKWGPEAHPIRRKRSLFAAYLGVLLVIALLSLLTSKGAMPPFFLQGSGPTAVRQVIVASALLFYVVSSLYMMSRFFRMRVWFYYWYFLALASLALGMVGILIQPAVGSSIGWIARSSQYLAGIYFLLSMHSGLRTARSRGLILEESLSELFGTPGPGWQDVLGTVNDAVISIDDKDNILLWNKAAESMFGYSQEEITEKELNAILPIGQKAGVPPPWRIHEQSLGLTELGLRRKDGSSFIAEVSTSTRRISFSEIVTLVVRDLTERKGAEEALRESERRERERATELATLLDATPTPVIIVHDSDGTHMTGNRAADSLLRNPSGGEMSLSAPAESRPRHFRAFKDGRELGTDELPAQRAARGLQVQEFEFSLLFDDGTLRHVVGYGTPLLNFEGRPRGAVHVLVDITERKNAEKALRESEERLRLVNEATGDAIWDIDLMQGRVNWNETYKMRFGRPLETGDSWQWWIDRIYTDDRERVATGLRNAIDGSTNCWIAEYRFRQIDGDWAYIYDRAYIARDACGKAWRVVGAMMDLTEIKKAEQALRESEEALRVANEQLDRKVQERTAELARAIDSLKSEIELRKRAEQNLESANRQLAARADQLRALAGELTIAEQRERKRIAQILHDHLQQVLVAAKFRVSLLSQTYDESVRQEAREVEKLLVESISASRSLSTDLSPPILHEAGLAAGLEWLVRNKKDRYGLKVDLMVEKDIPRLAEDMTVLLFGSIRELLFNVAKHAGVQSAAVSLKKIDGNVLQVIVSDDGPGFDPLSVKAPGEIGGGFGLFSISERLELIGGKLMIDSSPGKGSRFAITVPLSKAVIGEQSAGEKPSKAAKQVAKVSAPKTGRKIRVLLADDHAVLREGLARLLNQEPDIEIVGEANDGKEAVEAAGRLVPDVILMDISMPILNGVDATRTIHGSYPDIRIIGLSMFEEEERSKAMREAGAIDYLSKSGSAASLVATIRACTRTQAVSERKQP